MKREVLSLCGGEMIKFDTSFRVAGQTITLSGVKGLAFALGEVGKIQRYGGVTSESEAQLRPLFERCVTVVVASPFQLREREREIDRHVYTEEAPFRGCVRNG